MIKYILISILTVVVVGLVSYSVFRGPTNVPATHLNDKVVSTLESTPKPSITTNKPAYSSKPTDTIQKPKSTEAYQTMPTLKPITTSPQSNQSVISAVIWDTRDFEWYPNGTPPNCSEPFKLQTPVDMSLVVGALWPGQVRGGYKAHGGFRFNNEGTNDLTVRAPVGSHLIRASQYLEGGEKQYFFVFSVSCGFVYRFDHLRVLSSKLAEAVKNLPPATEGDSRTSYISPPVGVDAGEVIATSIGITKNIFVDFGLYDVRKPNNVVPNPAWADLYAADKEFGHYGVCFFDYLSGNDGAMMRSLPTGKEGNVSDYCK